MERRDAEVLVIGAGPGGLAAATEAATSGARTILVDSGATIGGQIWRGAAAPEVEEYQRALDRQGVTVLLRTTVIDAEESELRAVRDGSPVVLSGRSLVLATGARERFLPFPGWTLPGVFGVGALQAMSKQGLDLDGKEVVLCGTGPLLGAVAAHLASHGAVLQSILEQAPVTKIASFARGALSGGGRWKQALQWAGQLYGVEVMPGCWIKEIRRARSGLLEGIATDGRETWTLRGHYFGVAYGLAPNLELPRLLGCPVRHGFVTVDARQKTGMEGIFAVGELTGIGGKEKAVVEGRVAGIAATGRTPPTEWLAAARKEREYADQLAKAFALREELKALPTAETMICRCEDVRWGALEGCESAREARILTRCGMGSCQARVCGAALEFLRGWPTADPRPPLEPTPIASIL